MSKAKTIRAVLIDGAAFEKKAKGALVPLVDRTDDARLDRMPDSEVEHVAANDADGPPMTDQEWARGEIRRPIKIPSASSSTTTCLAGSRLRGAATRPASTPCCDAISKRVERRDEELESNSNLKTTMAARC